MASLLQIAHRNLLGTSRVLRDINLGVSITGARRDDGGEEIVDASGRT